MAKTVGVLDSHQKETDIPTRRIKCAGGQSLVNQGRAEWIRRKILLRLFPEGTLRISAPEKTPKRFSFIPQSMPPVEVSGLHFEDPVKTLQSIRRFHVIVANGIGGRCEA